MDTWEVVIDSDGTCGCKSCKEAKETKQTSKEDEIIKLLKNVHKTKFYNGTYGDIKYMINSQAVTPMEYVIHILNNFQKSKEPTLEEQLVADGYGKIDLGCVQIGVYSGDSVIDYIKNDIVLRISDKRKIHFFYGNNTMSDVKLSMDYINDYELIKKAVELVKNM